jgi:signal transduction histidine kinase
MNDLIAALATERHLESDLGEALARGLDDPSLELAFWLPSREKYVDSSGHEVELPQGTSGRRWHRIESNGQTIAAIVYDASAASAPDLIRAAGAAAALSLENMRLEAELRAHVIELSRTQTQLVAATDAERRRIERDLHDGAQQQLITIGIKLNLAAIKIESDPDGAAELFREAASNLTSTTETLRNLARGIHPVALNERGLHGALVELANESPIEVDLEFGVESRLEPVVESTAYFVVTEALTNVLRYAGVDSALVQVLDAGDTVQVRVSDRGVGCSGSSSGTGILGLEARVVAVGGRFHWHSRPGFGTVVEALLPIVGADGPNVTRTEVKGHQLIGGQS